MEELKDIDLCASRAKPLQQQLYHAIRNRILNGRYFSGLKLPGSRRMAEELGVARNTVVLVIEQLAAEGYVETRIGSGTFISRSIPDHFHTPDHRHQEPPKAIDSNLTINVEERPPTLSQDGDYNHYFSPGIPDLNAFPQAIWKKLVKQNCGRTRLMGFNSNQGFAPLRHAIADYLRASRACVCHPDQIIITDGAQQAISLAAQVLLTPSALVYVENPGYIRARQAFKARGCRIQGINVDAQGVITQHLPPSPEGKILSLTPTHQYPLGGVLSLSRRLEVLKWLHQHQMYLLEDDYDSEFHFQQKPVAAMQGLGFSNQVIYMGSFSKVIFPALRLGYLLVPEALVSDFVDAKFYLSGESSLLEQAVTADFLQEGHFNRHLRLMRKRYQEKLSQLLKHCAAIREVKAITPGAGMHIVLLFDKGLPQIDKQVVQLMQSKGVNARPLSSYYLGPALQQGLVLGFANATHAQIQQGVTIITRCLNEVLSKLP